ncbi:MAG: short-chain dehydrogenase [Sphingomonadales bacterium BRH_c42]|nr:MAG: short-chain dehydrogenase [Sphingomonadales bacterium BRH_c42]
MNARVAIVTGASRGIGRATAIRLASDFKVVALVARTPEVLATAAEEVASAGATPLILARDLRDPDAAGDVVAAVIERFGQIDALVNVAGAVSQTDLFTMTDAEWDDSLALKFHGMRRLTIAAWPALRAARGRVVITSGTSAITPKAALAAVGTINAAISAVAKAFAERGKADGVLVNAIMPGPVMTDRRRSMLARYADAYGLTREEAIARFEIDSGIIRYGTPEDIAETIAFLLAPQAGWITGTTLRIDGGELEVV